MSTKFEQLLDLIVNEEMEKANELFHEIVVEKSRNIYENLIAEEAEEEMDEAADDEEMDESADDEEMDEGRDEDDEEMDEGREEDDEEMDESVDLEDSYSMDEEDPEASGEEETDDFASDIGATDDDADLDGEEGSEDQAIYDIKNAIQELEAAFAELEQSKGMGSDTDDFGDETDDMGMDSGDADMDMDSGDDGMQMGKPAFEGRRVTREYVEKVGNDWDKSGSQKSQGQYVGAGTGEKDGSPQEGRSPISSGSGKPTSGANAKNIGQHYKEADQDGQRPSGKTGGLVKSPQTMTTGNQNVPGGKVSVKGLSKVAGGHGAEKKGAGPGPVGSGTGDKAGQTSVSSIKPFLKKL